MQQNLKDFCWIKFVENMCSIASNYLDEKHPIKILNCHIRKSKENKTANE